MDTIKKEEIIKATGEGEKKKQNKFLKFIQYGGFLVIMIVVVVIALIIDAKF